MKKVFMIGDSIRIGYCPYVREELRELAEFFWPGENCRFSQYVLRHIHDWKSDLPCPGEEIDVVSWNCGVWDSAHIDGDAESLTPPEFYAEMLRRIEERIERYFPNAKVVFPLSTPVDEAALPQWMFRSNAEIEELNRIARKVLGPMGVVFCDLNRCAKERCLPYLSDYVHYHPTGFSILGHELANTIRPLLANSLLP